MAAYDDYEDEQPHSIEQLTQQGFGAGYARALLDLQHQQQTAGQRAGERILEAAREIRRPTDGIFGDDGADEDFERGGGVFGDEEEG